jgi:putative heme-binding domain-containing protein
VSFARWSMSVVIIAALLISGSWLEPALGQKKGKKKTPDPVVPGKELTATPVTHIKAKQDFKVELLYSVPAGQGSWVSLTVDPKGRLITSDQYGKLYRITPPAGDTKIAVEPLAVDLGDAQGLLWAFDALYVVVNSGVKGKTGLYRVTSSQQNDSLDKAELLRDFSGGSEHGPHGIVLSPDGKSLVLVAGNHCALTKIDRYTVPKLWGEDFLLPRQWDAGKHAVGILAPGGWIAKTDPDGKTWELISMGYRNQYDLAYNRDGELFTYDSDMEWDMNTPWYRPTRVCHAVDGSEFGWRSGTGVYPDHYIDNLPPAINIGQGSPTGIAFGYGAKFPAKYQDALYLCDWSYGKLYAAHLTPDGASYKGDFEEFITGTPLPFTDIVVNPKDGAMYFTTGGRRVTSGLYRISYAGKEQIPATTLSGGVLKGKSPAAEARQVRHKLESYYGKKGPEGIDLAWKHLGDKDRFIRWAARTILEHNGPAAWQEKALTLTEPQAAFEALLALIRTGDKGEQAKVLQRLDSFDLAKISPDLKLSLTRLYELAFIRMGAPDAAAKQRTIARLDPHFPSGDRELNAELCKLLVYLEAPGVATKSLALLTKAPSQEEQMEYAFSLRNLKNGWTHAQREDYFRWFVRAQGYRGGHSFLGFVANIKADAVINLPDDEKASLKTIIETTVKVENPFANAKPRPFVKKYTVDDLLPIVDKGLTGRNFEQGHKLFGEAKCFACHRFAQEGGAFGPDLTALAGRFNAKDLLESIIEPSKVISDQYGAVTVVTLDGNLVTGRIINLAGDNIMVNTDMIDPDKITQVSRRNIESVTPSKISMMPAGLLDTFTQDEVLDLMGYLLSRGDRNNAMYKK